MTNIMWARLLMSIVLISCVVMGQQASARDAPKQERLRPILYQVSAEVKDEFYLLPPARFEMGEGERVYLLEPSRLVQAIKEAEGVPSYGSMRLARKYGGHRRVPEALGRNDAARIVHASYRRWRDRGRPGDFLVYLHGRYAPINAQNDSTGLNRWWLANVKRALGE